MSTAPRPFSSLPRGHPLWVCLLIWPLVLLLAGPLRAQPPPADETKPPEEAPPPPPPQPQPGAQPQPGTGPGTGAALPQLPPTEAELARGKRIARVEIVGNRRISNDEMRAIVKWLRVGKAFNPRGLTRDVRELWDTGYFDDIEVDLTKKGDDEVEVRILVRERPSIKEIEISGASAVDEDDIKEEAEKEVKTGSIISHAAIRKAVQRIRDKYAEEGYFLAEAHYEILPRKDNQVVIRFTVREHEKVTVRRVTFIGNYSIPSEDLRDLMITGKQDLFSFGSGGPFRQDAFERDVLIISSHYYDNGFLSVQVAAPRVMLTPDRSGIEIVITIDEGPRYKIRRLSVSEVDADGREIEPIGGRRKLREMIRAEPGEWFNRAELVKDLSDIQTMYRDHGYANVDAPPQTKLYPNTQEVDVIIKIRRGELVRFGRIEVRGNTKTRDKVIRRELEIAEGELFSETGLEESRKRIAALGYFERVDFNTEASERKGRVDVNIEVTEKPTGTFQIGAGFSSIESFIATAQVQQANLFGNGQSLAILAQLSGLRQLIDVRLIEPYFLDSPFSLQLNGFKQLRVFNQFALDSTGGSITFGYPLIDPELTASLTYTLKNDEIDTQTRTTFFGTAGAISVFQRLPIANLFQDGITSSIRPALAYDTRDNRLFPTSGVYLQGSSEFAHTVFGSDNVFFRHKVVGRFYYPITPTVVLKFQGEGGLVHNPTVPMDANDTAGVPLFARDFLGGIFDLRGFKLRSVGPRLPLTNVLDPNAAPIEDGAVIGGNLSYFQNLEVEFPIIQQVGLRGVVFTDLGNAWNLEDVYCKAAPSAQDDVTDPCFEFVDIFNVRTSWGFGLRWFSPLGPLRFEWGFPFKPLDYEDRSVFEFTIGNFF